MSCPESATVGGVYVVGRHDCMGARSWNADYGIAPTCASPLWGSPRQFLQGVIAGPVGPIYGVSGNHGKSFDRAHLSGFGLRTIKYEKNVPGCKSRNSTYISRYGSPNFGRASTGICMGPDLEIILEVKKSKNFRFFYYCTDWFENASHIIYIIFFAENRSNLPPFELNLRPAQWVLAVFCIRRARENAIF